MSDRSLPDVSSSGEHPANIQPEEAVIVHPSDVISQLHQELIAAQARREEAGLLPLFEVESLEIEMKVAISATRTRGGKLDIRILAITKDVSIDEAHTQTVRLKLNTMRESEKTSKPYGSRPNIRRSREKSHD
jgi:hypothetical protein